MNDTEGLRTKGKPRGRKPRGRKPAKGKGKKPRPPRSELAKAQAWLDAVLTRGTRTAGEDAELPAIAG